jgi:hypothetical protein
MANRGDFPAGMLTLETHARVSDLLVVCAFGVVGVAAALGAAFATDLAPLLVRVLG